jgi:hypothetical protein
MAGELEKFMKTRKENEGRLEMKLVKVPATNQEFLIRVLDPMDVADLLQRVGIDMAHIKEIPQEEIGARLLSNAKVIIDEFVVPMVVEPKLLPSTVDPKSGADGVPVGMLYGVEKSFLLNKLFELAVGKEGAAKAESFRPQPVGAPECPPRQDIRTAPK